MIPLEHKHKLALAALTNTSLINPRTHEMADISKCEGRNCEDKNTCWRYLAPESETWQVYSDFDERRTKEECSAYWAITTNSRISKAGST